MNLTLGGGLIIVALTAQYLISKRLKHQKVSKAISWVAWILAIIGGTKAAGDIGEAVGVGSASAVIVSCVCLLFIVVDIADRRPDWLAFILIVIAPAFMRASGGGAGRFFDLLLKLPELLGDRLGSFLGM
jgi:asparagine N-glycosylation enzyme membrane subunit Stt3